MFAFYAVGALTAAAIIALSTAVAPWLGALIVAGVLLALGGILGLQGKARITKATPPIPKEATESTKEDLQWVKSQAQAARH